MEQLYTMTATQLDSDWDVNLYTCHKRMLDMKLVAKEIVKRMAGVANLLFWYELLKALNE